MTRQEAAALLGLPINAAQDRVKSAYRTLAKLHHPDQGGDAAKFREVTAAYEIMQQPYVSPSQTSYTVKVSGWGIEAEVYEIKSGRPRKHKASCPRCKGAGFITLHHGFMTLRTECPGI